MCAERSDTREPDSADPDRVSMLDEALWSRFSQQRGLTEFARVWLALQIRQIGSVSCGAVVIDDGEDAFLPVAKWPQDGKLSRPLIDAVDAAIEQQAPTVTAGRAVAVPLKIGEEVVGAVGLDFDPAPAQPTERLRQLRWGMGWLTEAARSTLMDRAGEDRKRMSAMLDLVGAVLDARTYNGACLAAVNLLARETDSSHVGVGFMRRRRLRLEALSDVADFRMNTGQTRAIERAMSEAVDQEGTVLYPRRKDQGFMVDLAHAELQRTGSLGDILSVPMLGESSAIGTLHFQKAAGESFSNSDLMVAESAAAVLGPVLQDKRRADRSAFRVLWDAAVGHASRLLGPRYLGRKFAVIVLAGLATFFSYYETTFRVKADSEVQGRVIRSISAPFDGNIAAQYARAGDSVKEGDILAKLDETDLRIELLRAQTDVSRHEGEYDRALADRQAPDARIAAASIAEAKARAELVAAQLARAELRAPFDAIVTAGDLSQSVGAAVRQGDELLQIAPLESYRVRVEVDETNLDEIKLGQKGTLVLASLPGEAYRIEITRITPQMEAVGGKNVALVEAEILDPGAQIRPGMGGIAKIEIEERLLIDTWVRPMIDWARLAFWRWTP